MEDGYISEDFLTIREDHKPVKKDYRHKKCEHNKDPYYCFICGGNGLCVHRRQKHGCRECGGKLFCKHGKRRPLCVECGGKSLCVHNVQKQSCKRCGGTQVCEHKRLKYYCTLCKGKGVCEHGRQRHTCAPCGGSQICQHNIQRYSCKECGGKGRCPHGKLRYSCGICRGNGRCEHNRSRSECRDCGGNKWCEHDLLRRSCVDCSPVECPDCGQAVVPGYLKRHHQMVHSPCENCGLPGTSKVYDFKLCLPCGRSKVGKTPSIKRQNTVFKFLQESFPDCTIRFDRTLPDQRCNIYRPDALFLLPTVNLIIEVDENKHKAEQYSCEANNMYNKALFANRGWEKQTANLAHEYARMHELFVAGECKPTTFVRLNPDVYYDESGTKRKIHMETRLKLLKTTIDGILSRTSVQQNFIEVVYLYYDGEIQQEDFVPVYPEAGVPREDK